MKRNASALVLLAALGGCTSMDHAPSAGGGWGGGCTTCNRNGPPTIAGVQGPWGQPVAMAAPYSAAPPGGEEAARAMLAQSVPLELVQASASMNPGMPPPLVRTGSQNMAPPPGMGGAPNMPYQPMTPGMSHVPPGAVAAVGALTGAVPSTFPAQRTEVSFKEPHGMKIAWLAPTPNGKAGFTANHVDAPGRYNFLQGAIYRLKLSDIPGRPGVELYPTLEVVPSNARTDSFLAHSAVPVNFTQEDFEQVLVGGNYIVKVIYLPDPAHQDFAVAGPDELVSSRLDPGVDPIAEAYRRGSILLVIRLGNIDLELAHSPGMEAPPPGQAPRPPVPGMPGNGRGPNPMMGGRPMMGPNGPMMGPNGPMMSQPPSQPMMQPGAGGMPGMSGLGPLSQLPDPMTLQQTQYKSAAAGAATAAELASQPTDKTSSGDKNDADKKPSTKWWWSRSDK